jgi:hypothetical protein
MSEKKMRNMPRRRKQKTLSISEIATYEQFSQTIDAIIHFGKKVLNFFLEPEPEIKPIPNPPLFDLESFVASLFAKKESSNPTSKNPQTQNPAENEESEFIELLPFEDSTTAPYLPSYHREDDVFFKKPTRQEKPKWLRKWT